MTYLKIVSLLVISVLVNVQMIAAYKVYVNPQAELELKVVPDNFVLRLPTSEAVSEHIALASQASDVVRQTVPYESNIRYGDREYQLLDVYGTDLPPGSPIFLYLHGGSWSMREFTKENSAYPVIPLWREGIKVVVGDYDLAPNVTMEVMVEEIQELALYVLNMAETENSRDVWFAGHSAGAHLVATLFQGEWFNSLTPEMRGRIQGAVSISGTYNLIPVSLISLNEVLQLDRETAVELSPALCRETLQLLHPVTLLVVLAQQDSPVTYIQSHEYYEVLRKQPGINAICETVPGLPIDHYSIAINLQYPNYVLTANIISLIKQCTN